MLGDFNHGLRDRAAGRPSSLGSAMAMEPPRLLRSRPTESRLEYPLTVSLPFSNVTDSQMNSRVPAYVQSDPERESLPVRRGCSSICEIEVSAVSDQRGSRAALERESLPRRLTITAVLCLRAVGTCLALVLSQDGLRWCARPLRKRALNTGRNGSSCLNPNRAETANAVP